MKTRDEIRTEFQNIASGAELSGKVVDATIELLTEFKYSTLYEVASLNLESSSSRCVLVNSAITHARELMYCVPRGVNQRILIKNVSPTATFNVKQFEVAHTVSGKNLLYARAYNFTDSTTCDVEFIICDKKPVMVTKEVTAKNRYCVDFLNENISSAVQLFWNESEVETPLTTNFQKSLIEGTEELFQLTGVGYSVSIVNSQKRTAIDETTGASKDYSGFLLGDTLTLKYVPFYGERLDPKNIKQVPKFLFNSDTVITESQVIIEPESDVNKIWLDSLSAFTSGFVTRSNTDVAYLIQTYFNSTRPTIAGLKVVTTMDNIYVYYTSPVGATPITDAEVEAFHNWIEKAYYISQPIEFHSAIEYQIADEIPIIKIKIVMDISSDVSVFTTIAREYCLSHVGVQFNAFELIAKFQQVSGVAYSSIIEISNGMQYLVDLPTEYYVSPNSILLVI